jgi:hypothetical protein
MPDTGEKMESVGRQMSSCGGSIMAIGCSGFILVVIVLISVALLSSGGSSSHSSSRPAQTETEAGSASETAVELRHEVAERRCKAKGEEIAQGSDETTECVSPEQKEHEIERGEESGRHYEAEQQANEKEERQLKNEETEKIEQERAGG